MSEKDVKDNETEALNNAAAENAENADIEAGETDMATSIESVAAKPSTRPSACSARSLAWMR